MPQVTIVDMDGQYTDMERRRVEDLGFIPKKVSTAAYDPESDNGEALIVSGGPGSLDGDGDSLADTLDIDAIDQHGLWICYGMQALAEHYGGDVAENTKSQYGYHRARYRGGDEQLYADVEYEWPEEAGFEEDWFEVLMSHNDSVVDAGELIVTATSDSWDLYEDSNPEKPDEVIAGVRSVDSQHRGVQYHPEDRITENGEQIMANFLYDIAGATLLDDALDAESAVFGDAEDGSVTVRATIDDQPAFIVNTNRYQGVRAGWNTDIHPTGFMVLNGDEDSVYNAEFFGHERFLDLDKTNTITYTSTAEKIEADSKFPDHVSRLETELDDGATVVWKRPTDDAVRERARGDHFYPVDDARWITYAAETPEDLDTLQQLFVESTSGTYGRNNAKQIYSVAEDELDDVLANREWHT